MNVFVLILDIVIWILIIVWIKNFYKINYYIVYVHEKGHQKILSLFGIESEIKKIKITKKDITGECQIVGKNKTSVFGIYCVTFLNFLWELLFIPIIVNRSWTNIISNLKEDKEIIKEQRKK